MNKIVERHADYRHVFGEVVTDEIPKGWKATIGSWLISWGERIMGGYKNPDSGQRVLRHIAAQGYLYKPTYVVGDQYQTAFNEGKRHLALSIVRFIAKHPARVEEMINQTIVTKENDDE